LNDLNLYLVVSLPMLQRSLFLFVALVNTANVYAQIPAGIEEGPLTPTVNPDVTKHPRAPEDDGVLTNDDIIRMTKAGLSIQVISQAIQLQPGRYSSKTDDLIALKQAGVDDRVVSLMMSHGTGLSSRNAASITKPIEIAPLSAGVDEIGVYYQDKTSEWVELKTEKVTIKSGGFIKNAVTDGLIKQDRNGTVYGEHSSLILQPGTTILIYAPEGTSADEYDFVQFREKGNRREFRVFTGGVFHGGGGSDRDQIEFKAKKVATRMYTFKVPEDIVIGEYGVLPPGAAAGSPSLNGNGKMFTFRVAEANAPKKP